MEILRRRSCVRVSACLVLVAISNDGKPSAGRGPERLPLPITCAEATVSAQLPPCIGGLIIDTLQHNQLVLRYSPPDCLPEVDISRISDPLLLDYLCQGRAVFPYSCNDDDTFLVECLMSLRRIVSPYPFQQEYLIARRFAADDTDPLTVLHMALVRDSLIGADRERLKHACTRPHWTVAHGEYYAGYHFTVPGESDAAPGWKFKFKVAG